MVPGPTYPSPPPLDEDPPLRAVEDPPERLEDDEDDEDGRRESVGYDGMDGGDTRLSPVLPPPDDVEPPPDEPPDEPDEDDPPVRGIAVWADNTAGTARDAVTDRTTSERE
jgi:hypothetical protein